MSYDSILVPTDGSVAAQRATEHALSLAERFDADVHALGVVDLSQAAGPFDAGGLDKDFVDRLRTAAEDDVEAVGDQVTQADRFHEAVEEGAFREDLMYRLKVIELTVPPLRKRREDILPLARQFLAQFAENYNRDIEKLFGGSGNSSNHQPNHSGSNHCFRHFWKTFVVSN